MGKWEKRGKIALLWSGGKDAMLALEALRAEGAAVAALVTTVLEESDAVIMHGVPLTLIEVQAAALDLPLRVMRLPEGAPNAAYEARLEETLAPLKEKGIAAVAAGDLFLEDVKAYREQLLRRLGVAPLFPLWQQDTAALAQRFVQVGYRAVVSSVDTEQLGPRFAGRAYDRAFLRDLPGGVDPCGERGAFHTFVYDGPPFTGAVAFEQGAAHGAGRMRYAELRAVRA